MQTHRNVPGSSKQEPSFLHGDESHSLMFVSQRGPVKPWVQLQANEPGVLTQVPSCSQGEPEISKNENSKLHNIFYRRQIREKYNNLQNILQTHRQSSLTHHIQLTMNV